MPFELQPTLEGTLLELRPLRRDDFDQLFAVASDPLIWEQHPESDRRYNGEMKRLMLQHAFGFVDTVVFMVGLTNYRSQRAVEKIGGARAGTRDGNGRTSFVYRITAASFSEGPLVRLGR